MAQKPDITYHLVTGPPLASIARSLFLAYRAELGIDLEFQDFSSELDSLPGSYSPPRGRLYVARVNGEPAGCIALRPLGNDTCEMKRLFILPPYRRLGLGRVLSQQIIADARSIGYSRLVLDTLPSMQQAQSLYCSLGFTEIEPYRFNPVAGAVFMELKLRDAVQVSHHDLPFSSPGPEINQ